MSSLPCYTYLITMPSKFQWHNHDDAWYDIDQLKHPDSWGAKDLMNTFCDIYSISSFDYLIDKNKEISLLILKYGYKIKYEMTVNVDDKLVNLKTIIKTNAKGLHLETILNYVYSLLGSNEKGFSGWRKDANVTHKGWQNLDPEDLVPCDHSQVERLNIMNDKDGSIVQICECKLCKDVFKRPI